MELQFITQRVPEHITQLDVIELINCEPGTYQNGTYTVANVSDDGEITIVGTGELEGCIAVVQLD